MAKSNDIHSELGGLRDDLSQRAPTDADPSQEPGSPPHDDVGDGLAAAIDELKATIEEASENAEALVAEYPLAAVAAAFVLGIIAGRIMGHRST